MHGPGWPHPHARDRGIVDPAALGAIDAVIHLAGENIAGARWSPTVKARLRDSRRSAKALPPARRTPASSHRTGRAGR